MMEIVRYLRIHHWSSPDSDEAKHERKEDDPGQMADHC